MAVLVKTSEVPWDTWAGIGANGGAPLHWKLLLSSERAASQEMTVGLAEIKAGEILDLHHHEPAELYFVLEGEGSCEVDGIEYELRAGSMLFIPGGTPHRTRSTGRDPFRFLFVIPEDSMKAVQYHFHEKAAQDGEPRTKRIESDPALTNPDSTPGTGMLPEVGGDDTNMQPSS